MKTKLKNSLSPKVTDEQEADNLQRLSTDVSELDLDAVLDKFKRLLPKRLHNKIEIINDKI